MQVLRKHGSLLALGVILPVFCILLSMTWLQNWRLEHVLVHRLLELAGALTAIIIAACFLDDDARLGLNKNELVWLCSAMALMGFLDIFHALMPQGNQFVWFHSIAILAGGMFLSGVWLPLRAEKRPGAVLLLLLLSAFGFVAWSVLYPESVPVMVENGEPTIKARLIQIFGGLGFFAAFVYFLRVHKAAGHRHHYVLAVYCLLFGWTGVLFGMFNFWSFTWWSWHLLRLAAYFMLLAFLFKGFGEKYPNPFQSLRGKITFLSYAIAAGTAMLVGWLNYVQTRDRTLDAAIEGLASETRLMAVRLQGAYDTIRDHVQIVSRTPPIKGLMRSIANNGVDPMDGSTTEQWRIRLATIFSSILQESPHYTQLRYIGLMDDGRELVRVNATGSGLEVVPEHLLQQKGGEFYVQAVMEGRDDFFFSQVTYNMEHGKVDPQMLLTIRAVMPVADVKGRTFGMLVLNVDYEAMARQMFHAIKPSKHTFLINHSGDYVEYNPENDSIWLEFRERFTRPPPEYITGFESAAEDEASLIGKDQITYYVRMQVGKSKESEFLGAVLTVPRSVLLAGAYKSRRETVLLAVVLILFSVLITAWLVRKFTGPLMQMTRYLRENDDFSDSLTLPLTQKDEIGELARAFQDAVTRLSESEATRQAYVDASGDGYWDWKVQEDYEYMSPRFWEMFGYKPEEKQHKPEEWQALIFPEDLEVALDNFERHVQTRGAHPFSQEARYRHKDGSVITVLCKGNVVEWAGDGTPIRMIGTHTDLTDIKTKEAELNLLKTAMDNSKDLVMITTVTTDWPQIIYVNKVSLEMTGYETWEMIGQTPDILHGEKTGRGKLDALRNAMKEGKSHSTEMLNYAKDGREYWIQVNIVPVRDAKGNITHFAGIGRDITRQKEADAERERLIKALAQSNKELDDFAYVASHDLKAPLRVIDNAARWLEEDLDEVLDEESRENIGLLRNRVKRLEKLLDDLLEYSRVGRKMNASYAEVISGDALANDLLLLLDSPPDFAIRFNAGFRQLNFYRMPLQQVLLNLISNGIKHHDKGAGAIDVTVEIGTDELVFTVSDDGPGIAPEFQEKVFKMFQTLKPRDQVEGSGMGLSLVKKQIEFLGHTISLESQVGEGCRFRFTWPKQEKWPNLPGGTHG